MSDFNITTLFEPFHTKHNLFKILTGKRFGRLTVFSIYSRIESGTNRFVTIWLTLCDCSNWVVVRTSNLLSGNTKSCGCLQKEMAITANISHGESNYTIEYTAYSGAKARCNCSTHPKYHLYGGRGIEFRFNSFDDFLKELGRKPSPQHSLDRINVNGHYEKGNVRWATAKQQSRNLRTNSYLTVNGHTKCIAEWSEIYGVPARIISSRIKSDWCANCAVTLPVNVHIKNRCSHLNEMR